MSTFTLLALLALAYTYVGYPIAIGLAARLRRGKVRTDSGYTPFVSVLIPVYNGARYVEQKLRSLQAMDYPADRLEILVCSDGSTDETRAIVESLSREDPRIRFYHSEERRGKPTALNLMSGEARGEILMLTDVRQPVESEALRALVAPLADPEVACVSGNLVLLGETGAGAYWRYENWLRRQEGRFRSMLGVTGPIYAIRAADMSRVPLDVILDDMWIPMRLRLEGRRIVFAEQAIAYDEAFEDEREFGRKVRTLAGNFQLLLLLPGLLNPFRNPSFFEFFSHKLLRLICPFILIALFAASAVASVDVLGVVGQPGRWVVALLLSQVGFYLLALFPRMGGKAGTIARAFVVMNAAAVVGLVRFVRGSQRVTW